MYVVREITGMSMEDIGREFGGRDHSTVVYSICDIQKKMDTDPRTRETIEAVSYTHLDVYKRQPSRWECS